MLGGIVGVFNTRRETIGDGLAQKMIQVLGHQNVARWAKTMSSWVQVGQMSLQGRQEKVVDILHKDGLVLVADALIVNRRALAIRLGLHPNTSSHQIILESYLEWGSGCLNYLEGVFAFAIWDEQNQELFCAVDPKGTRPFCYSFEESGSFYFASELKCLFVAGLPKRINEQFFIDYLADINGDLESMIVQNCQLLPAGHALTINETGLKRWCYWKPSKNHLNAQTLDDKSYLAITEKLIYQLFQEYLGDLPQIGIFLNGSVNSAYLLSVLRNLFPTKPIVAVSYLLPENYQGNCQDDRVYVELLQKHFDFELKEVCEFPLPSFFNESIEEKFFAHDTFLANPIGSDHDVLYPSFNEFGIHEITSFLFLNPLRWHGQEYYRNLLLTGRYQELWYAIRERKKINGKSWANVLLNKLIMPSLSEGQYQFLKQFKSRGFSSDWDLLKEEVVKKYDLPNRVRRLTTKGEYPKLHLQEDLLHFFRKTHGFGKKPITFVERRFDITNFSPLSDRRMADWLLQIPSEQFISTAKRDTLWVRLLKQHVNIPKAILERKGRTPWPPDFRDRREQCQPFLWKEFEKIQKESPLWEWADRKKVLKLVEEVKYKNEYFFYRKHYEQLIKYPLINRYLNWLG